MVKFARHLLIEAAVSILLVYSCAVRAAEPLNADPFADAGDLTALVRNAAVVPHWIGNSDRFWYERDTDGGREYRVVNAATGRVYAAFNHAALSNSLRALDAGAPGDTLTFSGLSLDLVSHRARFNIGSQYYDCTLAPVSCSQASPDLNVSTSPHGDLVAFIRNSNLWIRDLRTQAERALTADGEADNGYAILPDGWKANYVVRAKAGGDPPPWGLLWSPDGTRLIVPHLDQRHVARYPFIEYAPLESFRPRVFSPRLPLVGERAADVRWYAIEVMSGARHEIQFPYAGLLALQQDMTAIRRWMWCGDRDHIYAAAFGVDMTSSYLFDVNMATGQVRTVISEAGRPLVNLNSSSYNPPNVQLVGDGREVVWYSERDGWGHLYLFDTKTGVLKARLTQGPWLVRDIISVDSKGRVIYFTGAGREQGNLYFRHLYRVGLDGKGLRLLTPEPMDHAVAGPDNDVLSIGGALNYLPISPSGRYVAYTSSTVDKPPRSTIRRIEDGALVSVFEHADISELKAAGYEPPVPFVTRAAVGDEPIYGVLYRPAALNPNKKYPVLDGEYDSPLTAVVPHNYLAALRASSSPQPSEMVRHGFATVVIDARGTAFRSRAFSTAMYGRLDTMNLDDHVAAIQQLAQRYPWLDASRVGIYGGSYGGWSAIRGLLAFPEFFKASIATVGPGTMHSMYADYHWSAFQGQPQYSDGASLRSGPKDVPKNWASLDSVSQVDRLRGPLLMIIGALDENVPAGSSLQFYQAALDAGKDIELIYRPERNHYEARDGVSRRRSIEFFKRALGEPR